jgi:hypothetical protein
VAVAGAAQLDGGAVDAEVRPALARLQGAEAEEDSARQQQPDGWRS